MNESERAREREGERERERVCVCVCERERERERTITDAPVIVKARHLGIQTDQFSQIHHQRTQINRIRERNEGTEAKHPRGEDARDVD